MKLYIGCSLTQAPQEFQDAVEEFKDTLRQKYDVLDFVGLVNGTPTDVYHWDIQNCVVKCDLLVAICDYPAIGLGYELGTAIEKYGKPVLAVAHEGTKLTRLVIGIDAPNFNFARYTKLQDVAALIDQKISTIGSARKYTVGAKE